MPQLDPIALSAACTAFLARHPAFCGNVIAGRVVNDPERVAYLEGSLAAAIAAFRHAEPQGELFSRPPRRGEPE